MNSNSADHHTSTRKESRPPVVLAITGASGVVYGHRLLEVLLKSGESVCLILSETAIEIFQLELDLDLTPTPLSLSHIFPEAEFSRKSRFQDRLEVFDQRDFMATVSSGSYLTSGMVICPCSMGTLASIANGLTSNLIHRAAHVQLKENRPLVLVPRETPLSRIQLMNMLQLVESGAVVLPAMPGFYHHPQKMDDLVDFIVSRICDQLQIETNITNRWGT